MHLNIITQLSIWAILSWATHQCITNNQFMINISNLEYNSYYNDNAMQLPFI